MEGVGELRGQPEEGPINGERDAVGASGRVVGLIDDVVDIINRGDDGK
jgi:hypothetical protein